MTGDDHKLESVDFSALALGACHDGIDVAVIPGEGPTRSLVEATVRVVRATGAPILWHWLPLTVEDCCMNHGRVPYRFVREIESCRAVLLGPPDPSGAAAPLARPLRQSLGLDVRMTHLRSLPGGGNHSGWNVMLCREWPESLNDGASEGEFAIYGRRQAAHRIAASVASAALIEAERLGSPHIVLVFDPARPEWCDEGARAAVRRICLARPHVRFLEMPANTFIQELVRAPEQFEMVMTTRGIADFVCRLGEAFVGGSAWMPCVSLGGESALFEAYLHAEEPPISAGVDSLTALIRAAALLLKHVGQCASGEALQTALDSVCLRGRRPPAESGGTAATHEFAGAVVRALQDSGWAGGGWPGPEVVVNSR